MQFTDKYYLTEETTSLKKYFKFGFSVDCVVFGYHDGDMKVLLVQRGVEPYLHHWALIGDLVDIDHDLDASAQEVLFNLTGINDIFMEQFGTFGKVDRHPVGRVITTGYYSLVNESGLNPMASSWAEETQWFSLNNLPELAFDHNHILQVAIQSLKHKVRHQPVGFELLPAKFTLLELQQMYESLLQTTFDKPNFRKKILGMDLLVPLTEVQSNVSHRPAKLFKFDEQRYEKLKKEGFSFEL